jgi:hypothetical protein
MSEMAFVPALYDECDAIRGQAIVAFLADVVVIAEAGISKS